MEEYEWDDMTDEMSLECVGLSEIKQCSESSVHGSVLPLCCERIPVRKLYHLKCSEKCRGQNEATGCPVRVGCSYGPDKQGSITLS